MHPFAAEVRERGWRPALEDGLTHARQVVSVDEVHTWYELNLLYSVPETASANGASGANGANGGGSGLEVLKATVEHLQLLDRLPTVKAAAAARRLETGAQWWLLVDGNEPVFSCWTFSRVMRMIGAPAGALVLPPDTLFLEDSVTSPSWRGMGVGPLALTAICHRLGQEGPRWILTKVKVGNRSAERLVEKVGFVPMATVRLWHRGPLRRTWVVMAAGATNTWLPGALGAVEGTGGCGTASSEREPRRPSVVNLT